MDTSLPAPSSPAPFLPEIRWGLVGVGMAVALAACAALFASGADWQGLAPATCMPAHCFCEHVGEGPVRQPANTVSNLGFVLVGLMILAARERADAGGMAGDPTLRVLYGAVVVFLGVGSAAYHASMSFVGQWIDVMSMYLFPTFVGLLNLRRLKGMGRGTFVGLYLGVNALLGVLLVLVPETRRYLFALLVLAMVATELPLRGKVDRATRYFGAATASMALAFGVWNLDISHTLCSPGSLVQGHAFWHLGCALTTGFLYLYYRSERSLAA